MFFNKFKYKLTVYKDYKSLMDDVLHSSNLKIYEDYDYKFRDYHYDYIFKDDAVKKQIHDLYEDSRSKQNIANDIEGKFERYITETINPVETDININFDDFKLQLRIICSALIEMNYDPYKVMSINKYSRYYKILFKNEADRMKFVLMVK